MKFEQLYQERAETTAMFESANPKGNHVDPVPAPAPAPDNGILEPKDAITAMYEAIETNAITNFRAMGMGALITWAEVGDPTAEDFDLIAQGMADVNEDGEVTVEEEEFYNQILFSMAQALSYIGVATDVVESLLDGSDQAASTAYVAIAEKLEGMEESEDELIAEFSVQQEGMMEAKKKVVRGGEVKWVNKPLKKRRISSAQRAALKKARMKANSAGARAKRKKSMRKRSGAGL